MLVAILAVGMATPMALGAALPAPNFQLQDFRGKEIRLADFQGKPVVVIAFLGVECPLAKQYAPKLEQMAKTYEARGVVFLGVDSNQQDSVTEMKHFARVHGVTFPFLKDVGNVVADALGAERTPEMFVLDAQRMVRYRGRVDDQYGFKTGGGYAQPKAKTQELVDAIDAVLAGKEVAVAQTHADGCKIGRVRKVNESSPVTFTKDIAKILQERCEKCHRAGEIGPFALQKYEEVAGWAEMIDEVVREQRMPPWHASPEFGHFANDSRLSDEEKRLIHTWVENGAPEGDPNDLPAAKTFVEGWQIGTPDQVVFMSEKPYQVAAEGTIDYQYFTVDPGFSEDKWIRSIECRPGNRSVVHHIIVFLQPPGVVPQMFEGGPANLSLLQGEAPGMPPTELPDDMAFFIPKGSKFVFQVHYTANGSAAEDISSVGVKFADAATVKREAKTFNAGDPFFEIPPYANNHPVPADFRFWSDTTIVSLMPHMHLRGKSFRYTLVYPDGKEEILLDVPRYDFNWQNMYYFAEPKVAPAGSVMKCLAHFDNSEENLANPDPSQTVRWGEQTWEEMMLGWFVCSMDSEGDVGTGRTKVFLEQAEKGNLKPDLQMNIVTLAAFRSDRDFRMFGHVVTRMVPQIDRICVSMIEGSDVKFLHVSQPAIFNVKIGSKDYVVPIGRSVLAFYLEDGKPVVNPNLNSGAGEDMARFASLMKSSFHVPIKVAGKSAMMSFWSREADAFPESAQKLLTGFASMSAKNAKLPVPAGDKVGTTVSSR
jgi:peroxiredoxin